MKDRTALNAQKKMEESKPVQSLVVTAQAALLRRGNYIFYLELYFSKMQQKIEGDGGRVRLEVRCWAYQGVYWERYVCQPNWKISFSWKTPLSSHVLSTHLVTDSPDMSMAKIRQRAGEFFLKMQVFIHLSHHQNTKVRK